MKQTESNISPLRQRMIENMTMRKLKPHTQTDYIRAVKKLADFINKPLTTATKEDMRAFQLHLAETGTSAVTINSTISGIRFLYQVTLDNREVIRQLSHVSQPRKLPIVLTVEEVTRLIDVATPKYQAAFSIAYGAGLRISEIVTLTTNDIDSERMCIHIHGIIPGGGLSADGQQWIACKTGFFLPVRVLSRLFRRLFLELLLKSYQSNQLHFYHKLKSIEEKQAFSHWLKPLRQKERVVYAKRPFAGPKAVLTYLSRYTHRVTIANSRLISMDDEFVTFKWKDYRKKEGYQQKHMTLSTNEFIQRFFLHILPKEFHRIRHDSSGSKSRPVPAITPNPTLYPTAYPMCFPGFC